jgi:hypothetical protein
MIGGRDRKRCIRAERVVINKGLMVAGKNHLSGGVFEACRPIVGAARMPAPGVGVKIVHEIAAADDEDALLPERRKLLADLKMEPDYA